MDKVTLIVRHTMETPWTLGALATLLIVVPIVGIWAIHKYNWEHWEPFVKRHESHTPPTE